MNEVPSYTVRTATGSPYDPGSARAVLLILSGMALTVTYVETRVVPGFENFYTFFPGVPYTTLAGILSAHFLVGTVAILIASANVIVLPVRPEELGIQTGINQTFRNLGSAIGPVAATSILAGFVATHWVQSDLKVNGFNSSRKPTLPVGERVLY